MNKLLIALLGMSLAGAAVAKLPPPSPEAQAKADEAKQKTAWSDKVAAYQLCQAQDRVAAAYRKSKGAQTKEQPAAPAASAAPTIPPCQDPGPYVAAAASAKVGVADSLPVPAAGKPPAPGEAKK
ncbi:hypothetical protein [Noviherbaspirillum soli]|uniref:hypothetical protein n=1 Tax=Noviherbaspirillum soli TaxID=1064518 RepID=UPI00188A154A|nr:hypothetical protein [Noviherbaspirillum soli]